MMADDSPEDDTLRKAHALYAVILDHGLNHSRAGSRQAM
jgi:hypothetical protein